MAPNNLFDFISISKHVMKAHLGHFYTLALIFFFPISFSFILSPTLFHLFNLQQPITTTNNNNPSLIFLLLYSLFFLLFSTSGVISTTYSVFRFFYGQPANLLSAIKSIPSSFLPLLATSFISQAIIFSISLFYGLLVALLIRGAELVHLTIPQFSPYVIGFLVALPLLLVLIYLQVNWFLAPAIVVVESCWGLEALRRSARLIRGMKGVALSSLLFNGFCIGLSVLSFLPVTTGSNWLSGVFDWVITVFCSFLLAMIMLSNLGVNTVLYVYCKANHGESEIAEDFGREYVSLPFHNGNVIYSV